MEHVRVLALDFGKKRIGMAVSDGLGLTALGLPTLKRTRIREDLARIRDIARHYAVGSIVIGNPLHMSGNESRGSNVIREFGDRVAAITGVPVIYRDERLTSVEAIQILRESGRSADRKTGTVDRIAAALLLDSYLEAQRAFAQNERAANKDN